MQTGSPFIPYFGELCVATLPNRMKPIEHIRKGDIIDSKGSKVICVVRMKASTVDVVRFGGGLFIDPRSRVYVKNAVGVYQWQYPYQVPNAHVTTTQCYYVYNFVVESDVIYMNNVACETLWGADMLEYLKKFKGFDNGLIDIPLLAPKL